MASADVAIPDRFEFSTDDPELAREFLVSHYNVRVRSNGAEVGSGLTRCAVVDAGRVKSGAVSVPGRVGFGADGSDFVLIGYTVAGRATFERGKLTERHRTGDVYLGNFPGSNDTFYTEDLDSRGMVVPVSLLVEAAGTTASAGPPRFEPGPVHEAAANRWKRSARFVDDLLRDPEAAANPLLIGSAARLLAATALCTFPNDLIDHTSPHDHADATPATVTRAIKFMEAYASDDISVADIAAAAYVCPRAVQYAFRHHLDTTPMAHLRTIRLRRAHESLRDADPTRVTVTNVATAWGFHSPSRFTSAYRALYGQLPSTTLNQHS